MRGYVKAEKSELKVWECRCYTGYYCGICKSIGRRYGQLPRMALSYDAVFLALVLAGLFPEENIFVRENCLAHPLRKKAILHNTAIDYAGDVMLIMAWYKLLDDIRDEGKIAAMPADFCKQPALTKIGHCLGKWIYLMDAMDDLEENIKTGAYNPLLYRFAYENGEPDFRARILETG
ncbi:MAG: DUF5685 family protein [Peptococcaceae bacterium]|nr:DUF5685 family protein [Peptococcaceae bacterium]